jgi:hypothetical protein
MRRWRVVTRYGSEVDVILGVDAESTLEKYLTRKPWMRSWQVKLKLFPRSFINKPGVK